MSGPAAPCVARWRICPATITDPAGWSWQTGRDEQPRDEDASRFAARAPEQGDPTGWFEPLYAAAADGAAIVPWDVAEPNPLLVERISRMQPEGADRSALIVGCGLGRDVE
ncbi:hypothetical protein [Nocardia sp. NPDC050710]|uniref:hypothetical protein n=1 Tax=Nocardia sp. NPDC050710 TaxID=3157220 RepID=UPI00340834A8